MTTRSGVQSSVHRADTKTMTKRPRPAVSDDTRHLFRAWLSCVAAALGLTLEDAYVSDWGAVTVRAYDQGLPLTRAQAVTYLAEAADGHPFGPVIDTECNFPRGTTATRPALQAPMVVAGQTWVVTVLTDVEASR